jgi:iron complex transport system substrate-binding protein
VGGRPLALLMIALAVLVVACTGGDDDTATATTGAATQATATATPEQPLPAEQMAASGAAFPLTVTDFGGAEVTIAAEPRAIISYSPGATEILFAIGAGDRLVAVDEFSDFPAAAADLPHLAYSSPDPEGALAHAPDLVILATRQNEQVAIFRGLGMTVVYMASADSLDEVYEQIVLLGTLTGREAEAEALVADMQSRIAAVTERLAGVESGPRVFYELTNDLYTVAPDTFVGALLEALKAQNVAAGAASQFPQLSAEAVIAADPEVVLLADAEFGESLETVAARPGWAGVSAVVNARVYPIDADLTDRPGPRLAEGVEVLAALLYPELFE